MKTVKLNIRKGVLPLLIITGILFGLPKEGRTQTINLKDSLALYLPFNSNINDESGRNIPTLTKGTLFTYDRHGNPELAAEFDGVNDSIQINNNAPLITARQFTICMWAMIDGRSHAPAGMSNSLFEQGDQESSTPVYIHFDAELNGETRLEVRSSITTGSLVIKCAYPGYNLWHHYVGVLDEEKTLSIFIDGKRQLSGTFPNDGDFITGISTVKIGSYNPGNQNKGSFYGDLDEVYIFNRALVPCEIEALYSGQLLKER